MSTEKDHPGSGRTAASNERQASEPGTTEGAEFPSARYFQIHFEYPDELLGDICHRLDTLRQQIADLQRRSDHDQAEEHGSQSTRPNGQAVDETPKGDGTAPYSATRPSAGPALSLQGVDKRRKARRKTASCVAPIFGAVSKE
jgi:hypothetical protein